jgi:hypothetical protein
VKDERNKCKIKATALGLASQLDLEGLKQLVELETNEGYKCDIIITALTQGLASQLDLEGLKQLVELVKDERNKCEIMTRALENESISKKVNRFLIFDIICQELEKLASTEEPKEQEKVTQEIMGYLKQNLTRILINQDDKYDTEKLIKIFLKLNNNSEDPKPYFIKSDLNIQYDDSLTKQYPQLRAKTIKFYCTAFKNFVELYWDSTDDDENKTRELIKQFIQDIRTEKNLPNLLEQESKSLETNPHSTCGTTIGGYSPLQLSSPSLGHLVN